MMHTLYLVSTGDNELLSTRAVRETLRTLGLTGEDATMKSAAKLIDCLRRDGHALLGTSPDPVLLAELTRRLATHGCEAVIDLNPDDPEQMRAVHDRRARRAQTAADREAGKTPEEVFRDRAGGQPRKPEAAPQVFVFSKHAYETAMLLIVMAHGNPADAAANCWMLAHTTEDDALYEEVQESLIQVFPHIGPAIEAIDKRLRRRPRD